MSMSLPTVGKWTWETPMVSSRSSFSRPDSRIGPSFQHGQRLAMLAIRKDRQLLIKRDVLEAIKRGEITLQFRRWTRPSVKPGGTLKTKVGLLRIGRMDEMDPEAVDEVDARRAGFGDIGEFRRWLASMKEGPLFHRIEIGYAEDE